MCGGDICVQACAHDPQVAVHAIRNLARIGFGTVAVKYSQLGFGRTSSTTREQTTPRNMLGFKDGTDNIKAEDTERSTRTSGWPTGDGPDWLTGGTYLVTRRIRNRIEAWDRTTLLEQERVIGRQKGSGAPMGLRRRVRRPRLRHQERQGQAADRRIRPRPAGVPRASQWDRDPAPRLQLHRRLRRFGHLDAGLFFIAFVRNPVTQFIPCRPRCPRDALNEYILHTGTAVFACPPGLREGDSSAYWGSTLFG